MINKAIKSIENSIEYNEPFKHWEIDDFFESTLIKNILKLDIPTGPNGYESRDVDDDSERAFITEDFVTKYPDFEDVVDIFTDDNFKSTLEKKYNINLKNYPKLRMEYMQDLDEFYIKPHTDELVKAITIVIYFTDDKRYVDSLGTELYVNENKEGVKKVPFKPNKGIIFVPDGESTWHGFSKSNFDIIRRSIIINYVTDEWRDIHQLLKGGK